MKQTDSGGSPASSCTTASPAARPFATDGCTRVVRSCCRPSTRMPSKPSTLSSAGTAMPSSSAAWITPAASRSLCAMIAVGRCAGSASSARPASRPSSIELTAVARPVASGNTSRAPSSRSLAVSAVLPRSSSGVSGPRVRAASNGSVTSATSVCPRSRRYSAPRRVASRLSMEICGTSSPVAPSMATAGMPRRRSASTECPSRGLQPTSTTASTGALSMPTALPPSSPVSVSSRRPAPSGAMPSVMPSSIWIFTGSRKAARTRSSSTTPTMPERPRRSERARGSGPAYPSSDAAASTRSFVASDTGPEPLNASEAVDAETPALAATSASVGRVIGAVRGAESVCMGLILGRIDSSGLRARHCMPWSGPRNAGERASCLVSAGHRS